MGDGLRKRLTYANVVATIALFIALGGGAFAATNLAKNSVGTKQLKNKAVKAKKLAPNSVVSSKVANGSLLAADFALGQIPAGATGPTGQIGSTGPTGPSTGPAGGDLSGTFPNPQIAAGVVGTAEQGTVPAAHIRNMAATIPNSSSTSVSFLNEILDTDNMFDISQPSQITIQTPGWYAVSGFVDWGNNPTGFRRMRLNVPFNNGFSDGDFIGSQMDAVATSFTQQPVSGLRRFSAGDTIGIRVAQTSGVALSIDVGISPDLTAVWIAP